MEKIEVITKCKKCGNEGKFYAEYKKGNPKSLKKVMDNINKLFSKLTKKEKDNFGLEMFCKCGGKLALKKLIK